MQPERDAARVPAVAETSETGLVPAGLVGVTTCGANPGDGGLEIRYRKVDLNLRLRVVAMQACFHCRRLKPAAVSAGLSVSPVEHRLEEPRRCGGVFRSDFEIRRGCMHDASGCDAYPRWSLPDPVLS